MQSSLLAIRKSVSGVWPPPRNVYSGFGLSSAHEADGKIFSFYNISTFCAYLEKGKPFTLPGINLKCLQNMIFVKQSVKLWNVICKWDPNSSRICFPAKVVSDKLCRNIQEEIALCIQVQIYPQSVWLKFCLARTDSPFCVFLLLMAALVLYLWSFALSPGKINLGFYVVLHWFDYY